METIEKSIKKTSKALICHEDIEFMGFAAEIMAQISEKFFQYLDAPLKRVCAKNTPIPYAIDLENEILPQKEDIKKAVLELISYWFCNNTLVFFFIKFIEYFFKYI